jgi:hypothetical protein
LGFLVCASRLLTRHWIRSPGGHSGRAGPEMRAEAQGSRLVPLESTTQPPPACCQSKALFNSQATRCKWARRAFSREETWAQGPSPATSNKPKTAAPAPAARIHLAKQHASDAEEAKEPGWVLSSKSFISRSRQAGGRLVGAHYSACWQLGGIMAFKLTRFVC